MASNAWQDAYKSYAPSYPTGDASHDAAEAMHQYRMGGLEQWNWQENGYPTDDHLLADMARNTHPEA